MKIKSIKGREILDSRGNPTVEVELISDGGVFLASVPSGASVGKYEAVELRDGGGRYQGKGVLRAIKNINEIIRPKLIGKDPIKQKEIDDLMIKLDGTKNKSKLGANAILAVSMAVCRAAAVAKKLTLYQYIRQLYNLQSNTYNLPLSCFNIINGGAHAGNDLDFQEFMICPQLDSFSKNLQVASEIYHHLKEILKQKIGELAINVGDEGGFAPPLNSANQALSLISKGIEKAGYKNSVKIIIDSAASDFYQRENYKIEKTVFTKEGLVNFYLKLLKEHPIIALEDPFAEDDFAGWQMLIENCCVRTVGKSKIEDFLIIGDDLLATNIERIKIAKEKNLCNGLILKINQIGTITEALAAAKSAKSYGWKIMVSQRSGETNDDFIADLAVGIDADFIKSGAPVRGERVAKYNRLLKIEEKLNQ